MVIGLIINFFFFNGIKELHVILLNELKQQIYTKTSQHVLALSRHNSQKESLLNSQFRRSNEFRMSSRKNIPRRIFQDTPIKYYYKKYSV